MMSMPDSFEYKSVGPYTAIAMNSPYDTRVGYADTLEAALTEMWCLSADDPLMVSVIDAAGLQVYCYQQNNGMTATAETFVDLERRLPEQYADAVTNLLEVEMANRLAWPET